MSDFTLDDIRAAAEVKYASMKIPVEGGTLQLRNPLRLTKEERAELTKAQVAMSEEADRRQAAVDEWEQAAKEANEAGDPEPEAPDFDEADQFDNLAQIIRAVADDDTRASQFIAALGNDLALAATVMSLYRETVQPGEA